MRADFWDVVRISENNTRKPVRGKLGYIAGIGEEEGNPHRSIAVWVYDLEQAWCVEEEELILLGHKDEIARAEYEQRMHLGHSIRVRVDPETGEGTLAD